MCINIKSIIYYRLYEYSSILNKKGKYRDTSTCDFARITVRDPAQFRSYPDRKERAFGREIETADLS